MALLRWIGGLMDRAFAVLGAVLFAQAPLFMQQYTQQLIGREAELKLQVEGMRHAASVSGKTLEAFIKKFTESSDTDFALQGEAMQAMIARWHNLSDALSAMQHSNLWGRPFAFIYHLNSDAFSSTLSNFHPGLPITLEGAVYALVGICAGYFVFSALRRVFAAIWTLFAGLFHQNKTTPTTPAAR